VLHFGSERVGKLKMAAERNLQLCYISVLVVTGANSWLLTRFCRNGGLRNAFKDDGTYSLRMLADAMVEALVVRDTVRDLLNLLNLVVVEVFGGMVAVTRLSLIVSRKACLN